LSKAGGRSYPNSSPSQSSLEKNAAIPKESRDGRIKLRSWGWWMLVLALLSFASEINAQEVPTTEQLWVDFYSYIPITDSLEYDGDIGFRHAFSEFSWWKVYWRPALAYKWKKSIRFHGGFKVAYDDYEIGADTFELRPYLGIKIIWPRVDRLAFRHFFRAEERLLLNTESDSWTSHTRLRYKLGLKVPLNNPEMVKRTVYLIASAELFGNSEGDLEERFASKRRGTVGVGYLFDQSWGLEFEYTRQGSRDTRLGGYEGTDNIFHFKAGWRH
jgi:hypothetical protein